MNVIIALDESGNIIGVYADGTSDEAIRADLDTETLEGIQFVVEEVRGR